MNESFGRRTWVKLWVREWLEGTTRYEMSGAQRAFWIDLLALAGRSSFPGIICAGRNGEQFIGYPLALFAAFDAGGEIDVQATLALFEAAGKIRIEVTAESPVKLLKISVNNWERYQSEYSRLKKYRKQPSGDGTSKVQKKYAQKYGQSNTTDSETEEDKTIRANPSGSHLSVPAENNGHSAEVVGRLWAYYLERLGKNPRLLTFTSLRRQKGLARLSDALAKAEGDLEKAEALMKLAVDNLAGSDFHRGKNDGGKCYDSWEKNLFKSQEQFERWLDG